MHSADFVVHPCFSTVYHKILTLHFINVTFIERKFSLMDRL